MVVVVVLDAGAVQPQGTRESGGGGRRTVTAGNSGQRMATVRDSGWRQRGTADSGQRTVDGEARDSGQRTGQRTADGDSGGTVTGASSRWVDSCHVRTYLQDKTLPLYIVGDSLSRSVC